MNIHQSVHNLLTTRAALAFFNACFVVIVQTTGQEEHYKADIAFLQPLNAVQSNLVSSVSDDRISASQYQHNNHIYTEDSQNLEKHHLLLDDILSGNQRHGQSSPVGKMRFTRDVDHQNSHYKSKTQQYASDDHRDHSADKYDRIAGASRHRKRDKEYLTHPVADEACNSDRGNSRREKLNNTYLSTCSRHAVYNLLSNELLMELMHQSKETCKRILDRFIRLDELIDDYYTVFKNLLRRYNCHNGYSVKWSCDDCKKAYKDWLCVIQLPYYMHATLVKPCISFCERVEQRCPYLHPITKEQYGGQPVFICKDPNIPFVAEITPHIPYDKPSRCYDLCHLIDDENELINDTLSKYPLNKCPGETSIAEQVALNVSIN